MEATMSRIRHRTITTFKRVMKKNKHGMPIEKK